MSMNPRSGIDDAYLRAFGPVEEYIKVFREDRPNRWKNLARRAFLDRPTLRYAEVFPAAEVSGLPERARRAVNALDGVVDRLNRLRESHTGPGSEAPPLETLSELYEQARGIILFGEERA